MQSGSSLTTSVIIQRIIKNRQVYVERNKAKEEKELKVLEAERQRRASQQS